jgi:hypothetical protein
MHHRLNKIVSLFICFFLLSLPVVFSQPVTITVRGDSRLTTTVVADKWYLKSIKDTLAGKKTEGETLFTIPTRGNLSAIFWQGQYSLSLFLEAGDDLVIIQRGLELMMDGKGAANSTVHKLFYQKFSNDYNDSMQTQVMLSKGVDAYEIELFSQRKWKPGRYSYISRIHEANH